MNQQEIVIEILEEFFPDECDIVGPANLRRLAAGTEESVRVHGGSNLDMGQVISDLSTVVVFISGSISILRSLAGPAHRFRPDSSGYGPPTPVAPALAAAPTGIDLATREAIKQRLVEWLQNDPEALDGDPGGWGGR